MIEITDLKDPRIHISLVNRVRNSSTQEFRLRSSTKLDSKYFIESPEKHLYLEWIDDGWNWVNGCAECNGKKRDWSTYIECDKHDRCAHCSIHRSDLKEIPWGRKGGWVCSPCERKEHEERKREALEAMPEDYDEWDYRGLDEITCPHCALEFTDSSERSEDDNEEHYCDRCDNVFLVTAVHSLTFDCEKKT